MFVNKVTKCTMYQMWLEPPASLLPQLVLAPLLLAPLQPLETRAALVPPLHLAAAPLPVGADSANAKFAIFPEIFAVIDDAVARTMLRGLHLGSFVSWKQVLGSTTCLSQWRTQGRVRLSYPKSDTVNLVH